MANRWVRPVVGAREKSGTEQAHGTLPAMPNLEVVYLTDPEALSAVLPPPLTPPEQPRVHVRITDIDLQFGEHRHQEKVGYFAVDAMHDGLAGEYPLVIPIDLEVAVSISRERFGEPKKLAEIDLLRDGDHVEGRITRHGVTFVEILGDVAETLPTPAPYEAHQFWFKFLPNFDGTGFDAPPQLVRVDQIRSPQTVERVEGKLVLRDLPSVPVIDLPVLETVSITWTTRTATHQPTLVGPVKDVDGWLPFLANRYE
jgi:acetoacetate decarboxylase